MKEILNKVIKYSLYLLVFLLPIFFLPWTVFPVALHKQILLSIFAFFLLALWVIKTISSGKLSFVWNKLTASVLLLLLVLGISTLFSQARVQSFWGMSFESDTFFSFILYVLIFFLFANLLTETKTENKNLISNTITAFLASSGILAVLFLIQSLWRPIFPWDFTRISGFNPIGTVQSLSVFLGGAFVILLTLIGEKPKFKNLTSVLAIILGILLFVSILLINFWITFLLIIFAATIIIWSKLKFISGSQFSLTRIILPLIVLVISLIFLFIRIPTGNIASLPAEISPTYKATFDIAKKTLVEGPKNFILGSGPATFNYDYDLYRSQGPNLTEFWQIRFTQGAAALPTFLATFGILGLLAVFSMLAAFFYQGFKNLISINQPNKHESAVNTAVFVAGFYFLISWFFYSINLSLAFAAFLILGLWTANRGKAGEDKVKEFSFTQSPQKAFLITLICIFLIVGTVVGFYNIVQKYRGNLAFSRGLDLINTEEPKLDEAITNLSKAVTLDKKDVYFRNLSQLFLFKINEVLNSQELSQEEKQELLQQLISSAEISAQTATRINPQNSQNWLQFGNVYENFMLVNVEAAGDLAVLTYQRAGELAPQNPQIPFNLGRVYKVIAEKEQLEENRDKNFESALQEFKKSVQLKNNFTPAYYLMAQVYESQGNKELALQNYLIVLQLEPQNEEIKAKVDELQKSE